VGSGEWGVGSREWGVGSREWGVGSGEACLEFARRAAGYVQKPYLVIKSEARRRFGNVAGIDVALRQIWAPTLYLTAPGKREVIR
jgi:hypothetical protein